MFDKLWFGLIDQSKGNTTEIVSVFTTLSHPTRGRKSVYCWVQLMDTVETVFPTYSSPPALKNVYS